MCFCSKTHKNDYHNPNLTNLDQNNHESILLIHALNLFYETEKKYDLHALSYKLRNKFAKNICFDKHHLILYQNKISKSPIEQARKRNNKIKNT